MQGISTRWSRSISSSDEGCTVAYPAFDLIWLAILDHPRYPEFDLSRLRLVQSITTPERMRDLQRRMPWAKFVTSFGATECASNLTLGGADDDEQTRTDSLGTVVPGMELKVVDPETGAEKEPGAIGELVPARVCDVRGLLQGPRADRRLSSTRRGGSTPAIWARSTSRAASPTPDG